METIREQDALKDDLPENEEDALKAIERMTDQNKLLKIAIEANRTGWFGVTLAASKKITDPRLSKTLTMELMKDIK